MSISILLVPMAVAAASAVAGAVSGRQTGSQVICHVQTRMRDESLLLEALRTTGATVTDDSGTLTAVWQDTRAVFTRGADDIWSAHVTGIGAAAGEKRAASDRQGVEEQRAIELIQAVDTAYGRQVQSAVLDRIRDRAPAYGLRLESENVTEDASVQLVFEVGGQAS